MTRRSGTKLATFSYPPSRTARTAFAISTPAPLTATPGWVSPTAKTARSPGCSPLRGSLQPGSKIMGVGEGARCTHDRIQEHLTLHTVSLETPIGSWAWSRGVQATPEVVYRIWWKPNHRKGCRLTSFSRVWKKRAIARPPHHHHWTVGKHSVGCAK